jgi:hypothetical protein
MPGGLHQRNLEVFFVNYRQAAFWWPVFCGT